jgi:hypothetical protein
MRTLERNVAFTERYINTIHSCEYERQQLILKSLKSYTGTDVQAG